MPKSRPMLALRGLRIERLSGRSISFEWVSLALRTRIIHIMILRALIVFCPILTASPWGANNILA